MNERGEIDLGVGAGFYENLEAERTVIANQGLIERLKQAERVWSGQ